MEPLARNFITQKTDLYFIEFINIFKPHLALFSEGFKTFLLEVIDKRIMLLHRNMNALATIAECIQSMGDVDKLFWRSLEDFVATQVSPSQNLDQLLLLAEIFGRSNDKLTPQFSETLGQYLVKQMQGETPLSVRELERVAAVTQYFGSSNHEVQREVLKSLYLQRESTSLPKVFKVARYTDLSLFPEMREYIEQALNQPSSFHTMPIDNESF